MYYNRRYYFLTIVETKNITRAAEKLLVSQPSLTQYLNKLEQDLDIKLIDRSFTPLRITPAGQKYYEYLKASQVLDEAIDREFEAFREKDKIPLRIGMPMQKTYEIIHQVFQSLLQDYPNVDLSVWEGTSSTVKTEVQKGNIDIGFIHAFSVEDPDCIMENLNYEKITIICSAHNPILNGQKTSRDKPLDVDPSELSKQLFFQMSPEYFLYNVETEYLNQHGVTPQKRIVMSNLKSVLSSVVKNKSSGFAFMPDYCFSKYFGAEEYQNNLGFIRLGGKDIEWQFCMIRKKGKPQTKEELLFWNRVIKCERERAGNAQNGQ